MSHRRATPSSSTSVSSNLGLYQRTGRWWCKRKVPAEIRRELQKLGLRIQSTEDIPSLERGRPQTIVYHNLKTSDFRIAKLKAEAYWGHMAALHGKVLGYFEDTLQTAVVTEIPEYWDGENFRRARSRQEKALARREHLDNTLNFVLSDRPLDDDGNPEVTDAEYDVITRAFTAAEQGAVTQAPSTLLRELEGYIEEMSERGQHKTGLGSKRRYIKRFVEWMGEDPEPSKVTRAHVADWTNHLSRQGLARGTIRDVALSDLSSYFTYLWERGRLPTEGANHVFIGAGRLIPASDSEGSGSDAWTEDDLMEAISILRQHENPWLWRYVAMLGLTGFRGKEMGALELPQVILKDSRFWLDIPTVDKTKRVKSVNGRQPGIRFIPVHDYLEGVVAWLRGNAKDNYLFPSKKPEEAKRYVTQTLPIKEALLKAGYWTLSKGLRQYTMRRGVKHSFHGLRKYLKSSMIDCGVQEVVADRYLGHSSGVMSATYVFISHGALARAIDAVGAPKLGDINILARPSR